MVLSVQYWCTTKLSNCGAWPVPGIIRNYNRVQLVRIRATGYYYNNSTCIHRELSLTEPIRYLLSPYWPPHHKDTGPCLCMQVTMTSLGFQPYYGTPLGSSRIFSCSHFPCSSSLAFVLHFPALVALINGGGQSTKLVTTPLYFCVPTTTTSHHQRA